MPIDHEILARSRATARFKVELRAYARRDEVDSIVTSRPLPRVKVLRVVAKLLHDHPDLPVERVRVEGRSGCSDFVGRIQVEEAGNAHEFEFAWDCRWRAEAEGWTDCFGFPDQIRAAEEFGWRCFVRWHQVHSAS